MDKPLDEKLETLRLNLWQMGDKYSSEVCNRAQIKIDELQSERDALVQLLKEVTWLEDDPDAPESDLARRINKATRKEIEGDGT